MTGTFVLTVISLFFAGIGAGTQRPISSIFYYAAGVYAAMAGREARNWLFSRPEPLPRAE